MRTYKKSKTNKQVMKLELLELKANLEMAPP